MADLIASPNDRLKPYTLAAAEKLVGFHYEYVEKARRTSLREMLQTAEDGVRGEDVKARVLRYLEWSESDDDLDKIIVSPEAGLDLIETALSGVLTLADAAKLRGSVTRRLESYPQHPALTFLRGVSEALVDNPDWPTVHSNTQAALTFSVDPYRIPTAVIARACVIAVKSALRRTGAAEHIVDAIVSHEAMNRVLCRQVGRELLDSSHTDLAKPFIVWLARDLGRRVEDINEELDDKQ